MEFFYSGAPRARSTIIKKIWQPIDARNFGSIAMTSSTVPTSVRPYVRPYVHVCQCDQYHASLQHTSFILDIHVMKITQTAVINIVFQRIFIKLDVSYASQHTFLKVTPHARGSFPQCPQPPKFYDMRRVLSWKDCCFLETQAAFVNCLQRKLGKKNVSQWGEENLSAGSFLVNISRRRN